MAYVALSRVRSLDGVHLVAFDRKSIMVSSKCLLEINRLRQLHRPDLPIYALPCEQSGNRKRKLSGTCMLPADAKKQKCLKGTTASSNRAYSKRPLCQVKQDRGQVAKQPCMAIDSNDGDGNQMERSSFRFHPVDSEWQNEACSRVGVQYQRPCRSGRGGPDCPLTQPDFQTVRRMFPDGNCLFHSFSMIITGSQEGHLAVRIAILNHMQKIATLLLGVHVTQNNIAEYIQDTHMGKEGVWGTDVETLTSAHLLRKKACICILGDKEVTYTLQVHHIQTKDHYISNSDFHLYNCRVSPPF